MSLLKVCSGATLRSVTKKNDGADRLFAHVNRIAMRGTLRGMIGQKRKNPK